MEIQSSARLKRDMSLGVFFGSGNYITVDDFGVWLKWQLDTIRKIPNAITSLINDYYQEAIGEPGEEGDPEKIVYMARRIGDGYRAAMQWKMSMAATSSEDELDALIKHVSGFASNMISEIEDWATSVGPKVEEMIERVEAGERDVTIEIPLVLTVSEIDLERFHAELERLRKVLGLRASS